MTLSMESLGVALTALACLLAAAALGSAFIYYVKDDSEEIKDLRGEIRG